MSRPNTLRFPNGDGSSVYDQPSTFGELTDLESLVIVGANGSGKSRLGYAIEKVNQSDLRVQRIAAQRALQVPKSVSPAAVDDAERALHLGSSGEHASRKHDRWGGKPVTGLLNDFEKLLKLVFAKTIKRDRIFRRSHQDGEPLEAPPEAPADKIEHVWDSIFPHRDLSFESGKILAQATGGDSYNASEMSDGERVALYLMASVFVAPGESVLIIDEPEIHLHRSIRDALFDSLEAERSDCLFVYLTHDIEFAVARAAATRIWLKEYDGASWEWETISEAEGLPDALVAEVVGSRRPILFVEGEAGSLDALIYKKVYPESHVIPVGGCSRVIRFTKALNNAPQLHHLDACGLIDRDRRTDAEVAGLEEDRVRVLDVAEIENVILASPVLLSIAEHHGYGEAKVAEAHRLVLDRLEEEYRTQVLEHVQHRIRNNATGAIDCSGSSMDELHEALDGFAAAVDFDSQRREVETTFDGVLDERDYEAALRIFNSKELVRHVAKSVLNLGKVGEENGLTSFLRRHLRANERSPILCALRDVLPEVESTGQTVAAS